jgi:heterotetrameric sarcosine oxidase gamma subunit
MVDRLAGLGPDDASLRAAWPAPSAALTVRAVNDMRVLALRHLPGGAAAIEVAVAAHGLAPLPKPGACHGGDPWLVWTGPTEFLLLTSNNVIADGTLRALATGREALACVLDQSEGCLVIELLGHGVDDVLTGLFDASAVPEQVGQGNRARLVDISAVLMRLEPDRAWIALDRMHAVYAAKWITHALGAAADPT